MFPKTIASKGPNSSFLFQYPTTDTEISALHVIIMSRRYIWLSVYDDRSRVTPTVLKYQLAGLGTTYLTHFFQFPVENTDIISSGTSLSAQAPALIVWLPYLGPASGAGHQSTTPWHAGTSKCSSQWTFQPPKGRYHRLITLQQRQTIKGISEKSRFCFNRTPQQSNRTGNKNVAPTPWLFFKHHKAPSFEVKRWCLTRCFLPSGYASSCGGYFSSDRG